MSAAMLAQCLLVLSTLCVFAVTCEKYVPVKVEIETNEGGVPPKIFTAEEIAKHDASDVSNTLLCHVYGFSDNLNSDLFCPWIYIYKTHVLSI